MNSNKKGIGAATPTPEKKLKSDTMLQAALTYVNRLEFPVFPIVPKDKRPLIKKGLYGATTDIKKITEWWSRWPNANIGVPTGKTSGFFVVDIDEGGEESLDQLKQFGNLTETVEAITGGGGRHILFRYPKGAEEIHNQVGFLRNIDIRGQGGYIVVPPSSHHSGKRYEWELSSRPIENEIAEAPHWLLKMLIKQKQKQSRAKPSSYWTSLMNGVDEGGRNNAAAQLAGYLFRRYVDPRLVAEIIALWNEKNNPPIEPYELNIIINSIAGKELERRKGGR